MWQQKGRTRAWLEEDPEKRIEEYRTDWSQDPAGSYHGSIELKFEGKEQVRFIAPEVDEPQTIHIILEAFDMAVPRMTSYKRFIVTVVPLCSSNRSSASAIKRRPSSEISSALA